jgi:hypothetical protein
MPAISAIEEFAPRGPHLSAVLGNGRESLLAVLKMDQGTRLQYAASETCELDAFTFPSDRLRSRRVRSGRLALRVG